MAGNSNSIYPSVLIFALCLHAAISDEPQCTCSKYSYQISTLERMLRTEIKVEGMDSEMKKYADQIRDTEERTKIVLEELKSKSENMEKVLNEKQMQIERMSQDLIENVDKVLNERQMQIERMSQDLVEFRNKTASELKGFAATPLVAFRANHIADKSPATDQTLVFTTSVLNEGQGYDKVTGQFTAPTDGLYHLSVQLCFKNQKDMFYDIVVDHVIVNSGHFYDADGYQCSSADTSVVMRRNMKAWVKCASGGSSVIMYDGRNHMNIFSGFLVHKI